MLIRIGVFSLRLLLVLFIVMPVLEMWVLIEVGGIIGPWPTIGLVLLTAAVGYSLLRQQGFSTLRRGQQRLQQGELPAQEMIEGLALAVSGALLLTPGFVTDTIGFLGLVSPLRTLFANRLLSRLGSMDGMGVQGRTFTVDSADEGFRSSTQTHIYGSTQSDSRRSRPPGGEGANGAARKGHTYEGELDKDDSSD